MRPLDPRIVGQIFHGESPSCDADAIPALTARGLTGEVAALTEATGPAWSNARQRILLRAMSAAAVTVSVSSALTEATVPHVVYKGIPTALLTGSLWTSRIVADADLLVDQGRLAQAEKVLAGLGMQRGEVHRPASRLRLWANNEVTWFGSGVPVDLHWRIDGNPHLFRVPSHTAIENAITLGIQGVPIPTLNPVHAVLACAVHGTRESWFKWRGILDLARLMQLSDHTEIVQAAHRTGSATSLAIGLAVCRLVGIPELDPDPDPRTAKIAAQMLAAESMDVKTLREKLHSRSVKFRSTDSLTDSLSGLARSVVIQLIGN